MRGFVFLERALCSIALYVVSRGRIDKMAGFLGRALVLEDSWEHSSWRLYLFSFILLLKR
jgi:hypothetical protein